MMQKVNSEVLPIENQKVKDYIKHVQVVLPALDEQWITRKQFLHYVFPPSKLPNGQYIPGAQESWLNTMSYVLDDIWWLCELQYHKFWSQIIFDPTAMNGVRSFLHLAPLQKVYFKIEDQEILLMYKRIKKAVFQLMKRLLRIKESDLHFMGAETYKEIVSSNGLLPVSLLFCLCSLYGHAEQETVLQMIAHVIKYNENLKLDEAVVRTTQLFSSLKKKLQKSYQNLKGNVKYCDNIDDLQEASNAYRQSLQACVQFLTNAIRNISCFLSVYKEGCEIFLHHDFDFHILRVYKKLITPVFKEMAVLFDGDRHERTYSKLSLLLGYARFDFISAFYACLEALLERLSVPALCGDVVHRYVQLMKLASKNEEFLMDLNHNRNFNEFHECFKKKCPGNVDMIELNRVYDTLNGTLSKINEPEGDAGFPICSSIPNGVEDEICEYVKEDYDRESGSSCDESDNKYNDKNGSIPADDCSSNYSDWSRNENSDSEYEAYLEDDEFENTQNSDIRSNESLQSQFMDMNLNATASTSTDFVISEVELQSAVSQTKDLLPHLGEGFIAMCLKYYRMDVPAVIDAILTGHLPYHLKTVDFSLAAVPQDILQDLKPDSIENEKKSQGSGLKELKRADYSSYHEMLNDRKDVNEAKKFYEQFRNIEEDEVYNDDVDDEDYEDTLANPVEVDPEGFYPTEYAVIPTYNPNRIRKSEERPEPEPEEKFENAEDDKPSRATGPRDRYKKPLDFCENPEVVRERLAHHRQVNQVRRYGPRQFVNKNAGQTESKDKDNNDQRERHKKNVHKSTNANHSRKYFSDKKRKV